MKKTLAAIELIRVVKELKENLINGKMNQIYVDFDRVNATKKEILLEFYVPNKGKQILRILLPSLLYLTATKPETPEKPDGYCLYLRKWLKNARVKDIEQLGAERIIKFTLEAKDPTKTEYTQVIYYLFLELFSKGNMILCNNQDIILSPLEIEEWSERSIKPKEKYTYPKKEYNIFTMEEKDFVKAVEASTKESVVTILALDFGLGGVYAEEVCARAAISKNTQKPAKEEISSMFNALQKLIHAIETEPPVFIKKENKIEEVYPCTMQTKQAEQHAEISFLSALDFAMPFVLKKEMQQKEKQTNTVLEKLKIMIASQEKQKEEFRIVYEKNQRIGNLIYENYKKIEEILEQLNEARKRKSWQEIKKAIKDHKLIKQINEKNQEIVVEL